MEHSPQIIYYNDKKDSMSFFLAFKKKAIKWIEKNTIRRIMRKTSIVFLGTYLCLVCLFPIFMIQSTKEIIVFSEFAILRIVFVILVFLFRKNIIDFLFKKRKEFENQHTIEGIPVSELIDFLIEKNGFKAEESMSPISKGGLEISRRKFDKIAKKLESIGVVTRGKNHSRVLSSDISREELLNIFEGKNKISELEKGQQIIINGKKNFRKKKDFEIRRIK